MTQKTLVLLSGILVFGTTAAFANNSGRIFIHPAVVEDVMYDYFFAPPDHGNRNEFASAILRLDWYTKSRLFWHIQQEWNECIASDADNLVSIRCVINLCQSAFDYVATEPMRAIWAQHGADFCRSFVRDLVSAEPPTISRSCPYEISKQNGSQMRIQFLATDGTGFIRSGGFLAWRFNNPGNLRRSSYQCANLDTDPSGPFAVFDSYETGRYALRTLLRGETYSPLTIEQTFYKYAPPSDNNNTVAYVNNVKASLRPHRSDVDTVKIGELSDSDLVVIMDAIEAIEGWNHAGRVEHIN